MIETDVESLNEQEVRSIHIVYRALHDGICPQCGLSAVKSYKCILCGFQLSEVEVDVIEELLNRRALENRLKEFNRLRHILGGEVQSVQD